MLDWIRSITPVQSFAAMSVYAAGVLLLGIGALFALTRGGHAVKPVTTLVAIPIPAIDSAAPVETQTATFGLG